MTPARTLLAGAALALLLALSACGGGSDDERPGPRSVGRCSWSYFGDPRSVAFGSHVVTGCIGIDGRSLVEDYDTDSGERRLDKVFPTLERDDHNNPSVIVFKGRLYAFSAPHSGYDLVRQVVSAASRSWRTGARVTLPTVTLPDETVTPHKVEALRSLGDRWLMRTSHPATRSRRLLPAATPR